MFTGISASSRGFAEKADLPERWNTHGATFAELVLRITIGPYSWKRGKLMMKSELPMTSSLSFAAGTASQDVAFDSVGSVAERMGRSALPVGPVMEFAEETLVVDDRFGQSPAQMVESKLIRKLQQTSLPVSHLQTRTLLRRR